MALVLAPASLTIEEGQSGSLTATLTASGAGVPGVAVSFQSSAPGVATVTQTALTNAAGQAQATVQGVAAGSAQIEASSQGASDTSAVTVEAPHTPIGAPVWLAVLILMALAWLWIQARRGAV